MTATDPLLFAPTFARPLGDSVAKHLGTPLAELEERDFEGGEHKSRALVPVRGRHAVVIASLDGDAHLSANDKLCRVLFLVGALRQASAAEVTAVVPYLCYSRKDRQTKARDPVTTRYVAQLFEAVGTDRVLTLDVHDLAAFQNAFRCHTDHLEAAGVFVDHFRDALGGRQPVVVSPDVGGVKRAARFRDLLADALGREIDLALTEKYRSRGVISGRDLVVGEVAGRAAIVLDDMISSGGTMLRVARMLRAQGAVQVHLAATHGVFGPGAVALFDAAEVTGVVVTDSVTPTRVDAAASRGKLTVLGVGGLLGAAIDRVHHRGSISDLLHLES